MQSKHHLHAISSECEPTEDTRYGTERVTTHQPSISMMKIIVFFLFSEISTKITQNIPTRYVKWLNIDLRRTNIEFWFYCCVSPCFRWQNLLSFVLFSFLIRATDKPTENSACALLRTNNKIFSGTDMCLLLLLSLSKSLWWMSKQRIYIKNAAVVLGFYRNEKQAKRTKNSYLS